VRVALVGVGVGVGVRVAGEEVGGHFGGGFAGLCCGSWGRWSGVERLLLASVVRPAGARLVSYRNLASVAPHCCDDLIFCGL
jgi:hypothetical protein